MFNLNVIKYRKFWLSFSSALVLASIILLTVFGLRFGLDFVGGSLMEVKYEEKQASVSQVNEVLDDIELGSLTVQPTEESIIVRFSQTDEETYLLVSAALNSLSDELGSMEELRFDSVGPSIGQELRSKSFWLFLAVLIIIIIYLNHILQSFVVSTCYLIITTFLILL